MKSTLSLSGVTKKYENKKRSDPQPCFFTHRGGHFCSLLISNIFSYPLFLLSTLCFFFTTLKHSFTFLQREYTLFLFVYYFYKRRMFCDPSGCNSGLISPSILLPTDIYQCVTPPCFFTPFKPIMLTFGLFSN